MDTLSPLCRNQTATSGQDILHHENLVYTRPVEVEIGFGDGEYIIRRALTYPERTFIGIDHKSSLIAGVSRKASSLHLDNLQLLHSCAKDVFSNLFASSSISRIYALFPDPWPKRKHMKYRLFSSPYLRLLNNRLRLDGEVMIVTDSRDYCQWIMKQTQDTGFEIRNSMIPPQFNTRFERKWVKQGYNVFHQIQLMKTRHIDT
jgi:tRNA (guanine-N7-)-methyltransferase